MLVKIGFKNTFLAAWLFIFLVAFAYSVLPSKAKDVQKTGTSQWNGLCHRAKIDILEPDSDLRSKPLIDGPRNIVLVSLQSKEVVGTVYINARGAADLVLSGTNIDSSLEIDSLQKVLGKPNLKIPTFPVFTLSSRDGETVRLQTFFQKDKLSKYRILTKDSASLWTSLRRL